MIRAAIRALVLASLAASASACASEPEFETPAWFAAKEAELNAQGAPSLANIPRGTDANTDPAHWAEVRRAMEAAAAKVDDPRSAPPAAATITDPAFEAQARQELEATRNNY